MTSKAHGIGLLSGGLDSALAARVVVEAGADITCLHFFTGFCVTGHNSRIGRIDRPIANHALQVAAESEIPVEFVDISEEYLPMVLNPPHGYGANMNPCIDCRIFMLRKAKQRMEASGADFVFTGEVIGQRPMSQLRPTLKVVERDAELEGKLLRPLSARLLEPTDVEKAGQIDREKLLDFRGRSRKPQLALAERYGITEFMQPAGGCCFLTDQNYSRKLRDLVERREATDLTMDDVYLLGVGRHFRLSKDLKLIVGRDEVENNFLSYYTREFTSARAVDHPGPTAIVVGKANDAQLDTVAALVARYCDGRLEPSVTVEISTGDLMHTVVVAPAEDRRVEELRI